MAMATLLSGIPTTSVAVADDLDHHSPVIVQPKAVPVAPVKIGPGKSVNNRPDQAGASAPRPKVVWPSAGSAEVSIPGLVNAPLVTSKPVAHTDQTPHRAGRLPVTIAPVDGKGRKAPAVAAGKVTVVVAAHSAALKAGVDGLLLSLGRGGPVTRSAPVRVTVDYASFRGAYGGDWASRLRLVRLPACALTSPGQAKCRTARPLLTTNDTKNGTLTAEVGLGGSSESKPAGGTKAGAVAPATVVAATSTPSGTSGSYAATSLKPSGSWNAGGSTGAFTWSSPIDVPSVPGGLQPQISMNYNSQAVDGETAATNNQPSWIGDGWDWQPGYVERRYKPCDEDQSGGTNTTKVGDLCWYNDNATLNLGGKTTELVKDDTTGDWHPADDSSEKVEKLSGAENGDNNGEYWKITTSDGTQYFFGRNHLPGWSDDSSTPATNSAWTVPVFGNQSGEPCYDSSFADAWCQQAWRWQLDYVVDPHGDAMAYYWKTESNNYGRDVSETTGDATATAYIRGGYLSHIDYGLRSNTVYSAKAMGQVTFGVDERCLTGCGTFDSTDAANWPDVPYDQYCKDGDDCTGQYSPTFWSRKRLTSITTSVLTGGAYKSVDNWKLDQDFPPAGDGISTPMWLQSITRTGMDGATTPLPPVTFDGQQLANRVDKTGDGLAPFIRLRLSKITMESGGTIGVFYNGPGCTVTGLPPADGTDATTCYPVKWSSEGETAKLDWFNSYTVQQVVEGDNIASTPDKVTSYNYLGGAAWTKSTDELTKKDDRTYSVSRGYGLVQTRTGDSPDPRTLTEARYFRGIDGQAVKDGTGTAVTDRPQFAGMVRESATYNGDDTGKLVSATSYTPWRSSATATRSGVTATFTRADDGLPSLVAYHTGTQSEQTRTTVSTGVRTTLSTRAFDSYGVVSSASDLGDIAKDGDERCTSTSYARNTDAWILNTVSRVETVADPCDGAVKRPDDVISDKRTYYDGGALGDAPSKGNVTRIDQINGKGDGYDVVSTTSPGDFDIYGRALKTTDPYGQTTATAYTPATGEAPTQSVVANALSQAVTTLLDPLRGQPTQVTDANSRVTTTSYDGLGRVIKAWTPAHPASANPTAPSYTYVYQVGTDSPPVVTTKFLNFNDIYQSSYAFFDGMMRPIQTQALSPDETGRLLTETFYDSRGFAWRGSGAYYADGMPEPVLVTGHETDYPASTDTLFDGAGRTTAVIDKKFGDEVKRTVTGYTGDTTTVTPPQGGTATTTVVDALGRTTELKEYTDSDRTSSQSTGYIYDKRGLLQQMTDPSGAEWTYGYDVRGRTIRDADPDKGTSTTVYDQGDRVTDVTDARGITLHTDYDELGRKKDLKQGSTTLAAWTYDTATGGKGQLATSTSYVDGNAYTEAITQYSSLYKPAIEQVTVPASEGALAGTYKWTTAYDFTGQVDWTQNPAIGGLPSEKAVPVYTYNSSLPSTLGTASNAIVSRTVYDHYGRVAQEQYGDFGKHLTTSNEYDENTGEQTRQFTDRDTAPQRVDDNHYTHDPAGNVTGISTTTGQDTTAVTDTQCFTLDALQRITQAWTTTQQCPTRPTVPTASDVAGPDAYWTSYTYDPVGDRQSEVQHQTASGPAADVTRSYATPDAGTHDLPSVTQSGPGGSSQETFTYDKDGNTATRVIGGDTQTLDWDAEGHLADTKGTTATSYVYDADGNRLITRDSTGSTLYLPHGDELHLTNSGTVVGTRYYDFYGKTIAMLTGGRLTFLLSDLHGTATTQIDATTLAVTRRKTTIFGAPRGTQPTGWAGDKTFVGGTSDPDTSLVHLGARDFDPTVGRFTSVDPLLDAGNPQSMSGYTYAGNNPVTASDPTGLMYNGADGPPPNCGWGCGDGAPAPKTPPPGGGCGPAVCGSETFYTDGGYTTWSRSTAFVQPAYSRTRHRTVANANGLGLGCGANKMCEEAPAQWTSIEDTVAMETTAQKWADYVHALEGAGIIVLAVPVGAACGDTAMVAPGCVTAVGGAATAINNIFSGEGATDDSAGVACSFTPSTPVLMDKGKTKPISKIKPGDKVEAANPDTGKHQGPRTVVATHIHHDNDLVDLTIQTTPHHTSLLHTTANHPFWDDTLHTWIPAGHLTPRHDLETATNHHARVLAVRVHPGSADMWNLTVQQLHTYYVLAGTTPILVHNSGGDDGLVTVGRWMGTGEYQKMLSTGMVQPGGGGFSYVVHPSDPNAYISSRPGSVYVEFDVPKSTLIPGGRPGDYKMSDSTTVFSRLSVKKGGAPLELPEAKNIRLGGGTTCP